MWRAFFLAMGIATCILGAECLVIEKFVIAHDKPKTPATNGNAASANFQTTASAPTIREMKPPEWAPWSLLSSGALVILFAAQMREQ